MNITVRLRMLCGCVMACAAMPLAAETYYVSVTGGTDSNDGLSLTSPVATIQVAIDRAKDGDSVAVASGVYQTGGKATPGGFAMNRVCIERDITVSSLYGRASTTLLGRGPAGEGAVRCAYIAKGSLIGFTLSNGYTQIEGDRHLNCSGGGILGTAVEDAWSSDTIVSACVVASCSALPNGYGGGVQSAYLVDSTVTGCKGLRAGGAYRAILERCTVSMNVKATNAPGSTGGAMYCRMNDCNVMNNSGTAVGGVSQSVLSNCIVASNTGQNSDDTEGVGGTSLCTVWDCTIVSNYGSISGGASGGILMGSTIRLNLAKYKGGGVCNASITNCVVAENISYNEGGGIMDSIAYACRISSNIAYDTGGGAGSHTQGVTVLYNCILANNTAHNGGGAYRATLYNCTVADNYANNHSGGVGGDAIGISLVYNSVVYFNRSNLIPAASNYYEWMEGSIAHADATFAGACTAPSPSALGSLEVITTDPSFVDAAAGNYRLQPTSSCINQGLNVYVKTATDMLGNPRIADGVVDFGCYEYQP